ncbi:MAG: transketolase, partial [Candidatus Omnitrophica bacterium]|nr:transketolase [Candidatus Omnitrophota bacterium]
PSIIIARTIKGKGVSFMENVCDFHGRAPTKEETEIALRELA